MLGGGDTIAWRLDDARYASVWDSGEGAHRFGGQWNSKGVRAVYAALDPSTAILEVAVHKGFDALSRVPHVLTAFAIRDPHDVKVVRPENVPELNWFRPGEPSDEQQGFGDQHLRTYRFVAFPSAVSRHSWNVVFVATKARDAYALKFQEPFVLDQRLRPRMTG